MAGLYPHQWDGAIPPNEETPDNPPQAFNPKPANQPKDTSVLYYGLGCDTRIRAHVLNSLISEVTNLFDRANIAYEASRLDNLTRAILTFTGQDVSNVIESINAVKADIEMIKADIIAIEEDIAKLKASMAVPA